MKAYVELRCGNFTDFGVCPQKDLLKVYLEHTMCHLVEAAWTEKEKKSHYMSHIMILGHTLLPEQML